MTGQDWAIIAAGWLALAIVLAGVMWDQHHHGRRLDRHRHELTNHARRLILQETAAGATSIGQPMASVTGTHRAIGQPMATINVRARSLDCPPPKPSFVDTDPTLRLARPPALTDLQHVLTQAGRALTATEIATKLGRQPWDLLPLIDQDVAAGRIRTVPGHTAGRTAYTLADPTERMPNGMSVLPGVVR